MLREVESLFDVKTRLTDLISQNDVDSILKLFKQLSQQRCVYSTDPDIFQQTLNQVFAYADGPAPPGNTKSWKLLQLYATQQSGLRDISQLQIRKARADRLDVRRLYKIFGVTFDEEDSDKEPEDLSRVLNHNETLEFQASNYETLVRIIERSSSPVARVHIVLHYLETAAVSKSSSHCGGLMAYVLRELHTFPDIADWQSGTRMRGLRERLEAVAVKLSQITSTANKVFVLFSLVYRNQSVLQKQLADFSLLNNYVEEYDDAEEPLHYDECHPSVEDADTAAQTQPDLLEAVAEGVRARYREFMARDVLEMCRSLCEMLTEQGDLQRLQLAIVTARFQGAEAAGAVVRGLGRRYPEGSAEVLLLRSLYLQCGLSHVAAGNAEAAARWLSYVCVELDQFASMVATPYFATCGDINFLCGLVCVLYVLIDHNRAAAATGARDEWRHDLLSQLAQRRLQCHGDTLCAVAEHLIAGDPDAAARVAAPRTSFQPVFELMRTVASRLSHDAYGAVRPPGWEDIGLE